LNDRGNWKSSDQFESNKLYLQDQCCGANQESFCLTIPLILVLI